MCAILSCLAILSLVYVSFVLFLRHKRNVLRTQFQFNNNKGDSNRSKLVAFFHPFCNAAGGGERVLWQAIKSLVTEYPHHSFVIYSGRESTFASCQNLTGSFFCFLFFYSISFQFSFIFIINRFLNDESSK